MAKGRDETPEPLELEQEVVFSGKGEEEEDELLSAPPKLQDIFDEPPWPCPYDRRISYEEQVEIAKKVEKEWKYQRLLQEYEDTRRFGFVKNAEVLNARVAMLGLMLGWLTERITGFTILEQLGLQ
eukprot:CAMPEP_0184645676 /NCGR_PEP_ID=MMETSP0308-20130426/2226_1 /TAXON_ID=38269 /ORGANISM="Gloeochaete witrockiana, Strain SAG 46.84" /LENGTH=125 /DNA_ID=CAMNT_0027074947 /DNA_START=277 /DNA_END=654 /DNA_ORIENTATION=-